MNLEELTKPQIVLLTLLVSFITSIATGIVTISLVDQAPPAITQSVSRVIRETVQNAVPAVISQTAGVVQLKPKDSAAQTPDLPQVISDAQQSLVQLYSTDPGAPMFLGLGVVLDTQGTVVADRDALGSLEEADATFINSSSTPMRIVIRDSASGLIYLSPIATSSNNTYVKAPIAPAHAAIGESVIALAGKNALRIASGLVVALGDIPSSKVIFTDVSVDTIMKGSPIINTHGEFVGISTGVSRNQEPAAFMPILPLATQNAAVGGPGG